MPSHLEKAQYKLISQEELGVIYSFYDYTFKVPQQRTQSLPSVVPVVHLQLLQSSSLV